MKHIAGSGARAGQWVNCTAKKCRLGGTHITERELYATGAWLNETGDKKRLSQITKSDVENFQTSTKGQETQWAKKAELAARKAKGLKVPSHQVFAGEKNLVNIDPNRKFVPAGSRTVPGSAKEIFTGKTDDKQLPPGSRYIDIPDVKSFLRSGDTAALRQGIEQYKIPRDTVVGIATTRIMLINRDPVASMYTNGKTGEQYSGGEIPEVVSYLRTGDEEKLQEAKGNYQLTSEYIRALKEARILHLKNQKQSSAEVDQINSGVPAKEKVKIENPKSPLRQASDRLIAASARLTNVTDDLSKLTTEGKPELPPRKGLLGKIFG